MKRRALGKGLDALLPTGLEEGSPLQVDIDLLEPNSRQPRQRFAQESLEELASSIRENGIVQPIVVRERDGRYEIIAGERRWRAAQLATLAKVPVVVRAVPDDKLLELALIENIQREDLNPMEEARAYQTLLEEEGLRQEDLAKRLGKARSTIANATRLLQLPAKVQALLESRQLSAGQARPLLAIADAAQQAELAEVVIKRGLSAREVEQLISRLGEKAASQPAEERKDPHVMAAEEKLSHHLAARVRIQEGARGGRIVIQYSSAEELERLYELLCQTE